MGRAYPTGAAEAKSDTLIAVIQDNLRKKVDFSDILNCNTNFKRFEDFAGLIRKLQFDDISGAGSLPAESVLSALKAFKIPVDSGKLNVSG